MKTRCIFVIFCASIRRKRSIVQTAKHICDIYGEGAVVENTIRLWFTSFKSENVKLKNEIVLVGAQLLILAKSKR